VAILLGFLKRMTMERAATQQEDVTDFFITKKKVESHYIGCP